jgi:hypothetical protein
VFIPVDHQRFAILFDQATCQDDETEPGDAGGIFAGGAGHGSVQMRLGHESFLSDQVRSFSSQEMKSDHRDRDAAMA